MPVPLLLIGAAVAGAAGIGTWLDSRGREKTARNIYLRHRKRYESDSEHCNKCTKNVNEELANLGKRRLDSICSLKSAAKFLKKARIRNRKMDKEFDFAPEILAKWEGPSMEVSTIIRDATKSVTAGASTAVGVYGAVGSLGSASTGTAISSLSGAAVPKATLAWLGGGSLATGGGGMAVGVLTLGSLFVGPAALVSGFVEMSRAARFVTEVESKKAEMKVARVKIRQQVEMIEVYRHRIRELRKSIDETEKSLQRLIEVGDPAVDDDAYKVWLAAKTLGELLDTPISSENNEPLDKD